MEERALAVDREIIGMDNQLVGSLKLTAPHDLLTRMVVPVLHRLQDAYPGLDIDLIGTTGLLDLAARQADIALRLTAKPPDYLIGRKVLPLCHGVYASTRYLGTPRKLESVILWDSEDNFPQWVEQHFKGAKLALRTDDVNVMAAAVKHHCGLARMPCFVGDREADLRRIDVSLNPSTWGVWVLSHVDLRSTARVRVCREFLVDIMIEQRGLIEGLNSRYA
jgi:DNA-binding transcriptional LysR family regulator